MISELIKTNIEKEKKLFALLIDPDNYTTEKLTDVTQKADNAKVDLILIGGSLLNNDVDKTIETIKKYTNIPVLLFPGSLLQISDKADGILLLSLISGRNPDLLIGNHVIASAHIKRSKLEVLPTGYILVNGGKPTSVEYMSNTQPIPSEKTDIAVATAMAGEMLGLKYIYLEAGSGADNAVNIKMIEDVKTNIAIPLIVGGGIRTPEDITNALKAGADLVVVGTAIEENSNSINSLVEATKSFLP